MESRKWDGAGGSGTWSAGREAQEEEEQMRVTAPVPFQVRTSVILGWTQKRDFSDRWTQKRAEGGRT